MPTLYGILPLAKICPVQNFAVIFDNAVKLNWKTLCTEYRFSEGVKDFLSISVHSIFYQPELFLIESSVINLQHDFYFESASIQDALLEVANVLFEFLEKLDKEYKRLKLIPLGFYFENSMESVISLRAITDQFLSITMLKEILMENLEKGRSMNMKMIAVYDDPGQEITFKLFQIDLNVFLVENNQIYAVKKHLTISDYLRFFFSAEDCKYFSEFVPYNRTQVLNQIAEEKKKMVSERPLRQSRSF